MCSMVMSEHGLEALKWLFASAMVVTIVAAIAYVYVEYLKTYRDIAISQKKVYKNKKDE